MKKRLAQRSARALFYLGALSLLSLPAWSAAPDYAMQMEKAATSMLLDIAAAGDRLVAVGERGHILYSDDNGDSWVQAQVPTSMMLTRVFFISPELGWAVGHDGNVVVTRDGGVTWELQRDGITDQARILEERADRAKAQAAALYEQVQNAPEEEKAELEDQLVEAAYAVESALEAINEPVYAPPLMDVWFADEQQGWAAGAYGSLLRTTNGGERWDDWSFEVDNPDELHLNGVAGAPDGTLYLASEWGTVFRSLSEGSGWEPLETGYDGSFFGVVVNPATGSVFAYGLLGTVYRSTDKGENWEELSSMARASLFGGLGTIDGTLVFVGQGGTVTRSEDDGDSFSALIQPSRAGLHGVARMSDGRLIGTGDGGSRVLATDGAASGGAQ